MRMPKDSVKKPAGFTLLEVILALALFSLLASSTWLFLSGLHRLESKTKEFAVPRDLLVAALYVRNDVRLFAEGYPPWLKGKDRADPSAVRQQPFAWDLVPPPRKGGLQEGYGVLAKYSPDEKYWFKLYVDRDKSGRTSLRWKKSYEEGRLAVWTRGETVRFRFFDKEGREIRTGKEGSSHRVEDYLRVEIEQGEKRGSVLFTPWPLPAEWILPPDEEER